MWQLYEMSCPPLENFLYAPMTRTVLYSLCKSTQVSWEWEKPFVTAHGVDAIESCSTIHILTLFPVTYVAGKLHYSMFPCCVEVHLQTQKQMDPATCNCIAFRQLDNDVRRATNDTDTEETLHWAATVGSRSSIWSLPAAALLYLCSKHSSSLTRSIETDVWPFLPWLLCPSDAFDPPRNLVTM